MFRFVVIGKPVVKKNCRTIYVNQSTGKPFIGKKQELIDYEESVYSQLVQQRMEYENNGFKVFPINKQVAVYYAVFLNNNRRCDCANLKEAVQDALVKSNILKDDSFKIINPETTFVMVDKNNEPRIEISIINNDNI